MFLDRLSGFRGMRASFEESIFSLAERQKGTFELVAVEQETKHQVVLGFFNMEDEVIVSWDELLVNLKTKFRGRTTLNLYARNNGTRKWFRLLSSRNSTMCHRFNDSDSLNVGGDRLFRIILNDQSNFVIRCDKNAGRFARKYMDSMEKRFRDSRRFFVSRI